MKVRTRPIAKLTTPALTCKRCGKPWIPRKPQPKFCPHCHSPYWWIEKGQLPQGNPAWRKTGKVRDLGKSKKSS